MITRRLLIEYLLMVGIPLILLLGVLHQGRSLQAPAEIQGDWKLALNSSAATPAPCGPLRGLDGSAIVISQSGSYLTASMSNSEKQILKGRSEGADLWLRVGSGRGSCSKRRAAAIDWHGHRQAGRAIDSWHSPHAAQRGLPPAGF